MVRKLQEILLDNNNNSNNSNNSVNSNENSNNTDIIKEIHKLDVNLKRLIQASENLISNPKSNKDLLSVEKYITVLFTKYSQLKDLIENNSNQINIYINNNKINNADSNSVLVLPTKESLNEYSRKINVLVGLVNQEKLNSPTSNKLSMIRLQSSNISHGEKMNEVHTVMKTRNKEQVKKTELLLGTNSSNSNNNINSTTATSPSSSTSPSLSTSPNSMFNDKIQSPALQYRAKFQNKNSELSKLLGTNTNDHAEQQRFSQLSFQDITNQQRAMQDELALEMANAAMHLKNHSNKMSSMLGSDLHKLDEMNSQLDTNQARIGEEQDRLKVYTKKNRSDTFNYILIIILVMIAFIFTYLFMKIFPKPN